MPRTTTPATEASVPEPPAAAVAADAHWAAKLQRLKNRRLPEKTLRLWDDSEQKAAFHDIKAHAVYTRKKAEAQPEDTVLRAAAEMAANALALAETAADKQSIVLTFRALPGDGFTDLVKEHPPTPEQSEQDPGIEWNPDTFPAALIAAASVDGITLDEATEWMATWAHGDRIDLFQAALAPQTDRRGDLGKG